MKLRTTLAALLAAAFTTCTALAGKNVVRLEAARAIQPTSTFELRFDTDMIPDEQIGRPAETSPVVFRPALKGSFVWLSRRSGTFKPEEPLALSTTYSLTLTPGLAKADGEPLDADFRATVETPPMQVKGWNSPNWGGSDDASAVPKFSLLFNVNVEPAELEAHCQYVNAQGTKIAAKVTAADPANSPEQAFPSWRSKDQSLRTWADRFYESRRSPTGLEARPALTSARNHLWVEPAMNLPAGDGWRLVIAAGMAASEGELHLLAPYEIGIGTVRPFTVTSAEARNFLGDERKMTLTFSKNLAAHVTAENLARWVRIEPPVPECRTTMQPRAVVFSGGFATGQQYRVVVEAGLPAAEAFVLAEEFRKELRVEPVPPRIYFEEFATHQLSSGARKFHLLSVNVPRIRVSARLFTPETAAAALRQWDSYENPVRPANQPRRDEPFDKIALSDVPGQVVWEKEFAMDPGEDKLRQLVLHWDSILGENRTGVVLLTAEQSGQPAKPGARPGSQTLVQVTDLGVVWKRSKDEIFAHVFSLAKGRAVAGAKVSLLDADDRVLESVAADAAGVAHLKASSDARWLVAQNGSDLHLVEFRHHAEYLSLHRLGIREVDVDDDERADDDSRPALLFTERAVYQPGETVHLKGILRDWRTDRARIPAGARVILQVRDAQERTLVKRTATTSDLGSFSEDFKLPSTGLGTYSVQLAMEDDGPTAAPIATHEFEVQEFTPNAFEIKIAPTPREIGVTKIDLPVSAKYYMGKTLSQAQLTWSLGARECGFAPAGFGDFAFCQTVRDYHLRERLGRSTNFYEQGKVELDAQGVGRVSTTIPPMTKGAQPRAAHLLCEITDLNQQTVSQSTDFVIHSSDFYLGVRRPRGLVREREKLLVEVIAIRSDGTPTAQPVEATVRLTRVEWQNQRIETAGGAIQFRNEMRLVPAGEAQIRTRPVEQKDGKWTLASAGEGASLAVGEPGQYLLEAVSKDSAGREVITSTAFNVHGAGQTEWSYRNQYQIELAADREEYLAGQTARVLVKTPFSGAALVTVERDRVVRSFVAQLRGNSPTIEVPLEDADAPNVFVSVMMLRGAADSPRKFPAPEYRVGYCKLKVTRPDAKLAVHVEPSRASFRPGEQVQVGARVLDFQGRAVANAEVTLYAVDEGVLSLTGYETPKPLVFFNQERALAVTTGLTIPTLLSEDPQDRGFANKGYLVGGGGEDAAGAMRKNFLACALWSSALRTDADGRVTASFTAPDSLTRSRVMAVVHTARDQFGSGESAFEINKPVMLEPALPRFANVGDKIVLRAVVHNLTDAEGDVDVRLELDSTAAAAETKRRIVLPAHGSVAVDFPVEFQEVGRAMWKWTAQFSSGKVAFRDAVRSTLNVGYPVPLHHELRTGETRAADVDLLAGANPQLLDGTGTIRVSVTNSRIIELRESLERLLHYPYGCVEQTTSSTLPWVTMRDFRRVLPSLQRTDEEVTDAVNRGVNRLLSMQTTSGGLSYWPGETQPLFWGSAYGGFGLATARRAGFEVPEEPFDRLCKYLSAQLRSADGERFDAHYRGRGPSDRCLALYTLAIAGRAEPAYHELLFKKRHELSAENRALLALAIVESKGPSEMAAELLNPRQEGRLPADDSFWSMSRDSAMRLLAWNQHQPAAPQVGQLVSELLARRVGGHWGTTQGNCWSLLALGDYFRRVEKADGEIAGTLVWRGQPTSFAIGEKNPMQMLVLQLGKSGASPALHLANPAKKQLFTEVMIESRPKAIQEPAQDQGYGITRDYAKIEDDGSLSASQDLRVGDRVLVTLRLDVRRPAQYLAVDDPLPAIFEAINPAFKSQETRGGEALARDWVSDHHELREDRALFFANDIYPGQYTIRYPARVRAVGTVTAPSAKIEEMYHPERFGLTETLRLTSRPLK